MVDVDGVVGGLVQLVEDAHLASRLGCRREHRLAEMLLADHLRATEGEEDATLADTLKSLDVEARVALEGVAQRATVLGEGGRVEDDQVVLVVVAVEILEGVLAESLMAMILGRKLSATLALVSSTALAELSTEWTWLAPPRIA